MEVGRTSFWVYGEWCKNGNLVDPAIIFFFDHLTTWPMHAEGRMQADVAFFKICSKDGEALACDGFKTYLAVHLSHATDYHRQVGQMFDTLADPSWSGWFTEST